jgi:hypothetical protein
VRVRDPDTTKPAANDAPVTIRISAPHGTPITVKPANDEGPWVTAISGAIALNALVWILAVIISG